MLSHAFRHGTDHPYRILCFGAHSDDLEIGLGGTMLRLRATYPNSIVRWVVFSGAGTPREAEARAGAAHFLGERDTVEVLGFRDAFFPQQTEAIKEHVERELKPFGPDLVFTHYREDRHQDHRVLSDLAWNTFRSHLVLEYEILKYDGDLGQPNVYVPLDSSQVSEKTRALMDAFASQRDRHWFTPDTFEALMRVRGIECAHRYAEAFYGRKLIW